VAIPIFGNFLGLTDASGNATGITVALPNDPALAYLPLCLQGGVFNNTGGVELTNIICNCVVP
jgi:hypothetical protein